MREITGNLWDHNNVDTVICITTNGFVKKNGEAVMGRGCAREACVKYPGLSKRLGAHLLLRGNVPVWLTTGLVTFPVKHNWYEDADLALIALSAEWLKREALNLGQKWFVLPRPGCGNGRLQWDDVRPLLLDLPSNVLVIDFAR